MLCFDLTAPNNPEEIEVTIDALCNSLTLAKCFPGSSRLAFIGLIIIREKPGVIFPLQDWRVHPELLQEVCKTIKKLGEEDFSNEAFKEISIPDVLDQAVAEFKKREQSIINDLSHLKLRNYADLVEKIQLFTLKPSFSGRGRRVLRTYHEFLNFDVDSSSNDDLDTFRNSLTDIHFESIEELKISPEESDSSTIIEFFDVVNEPVPLNSLILNWMQEPVGEKEHLQLNIDTDNSLELKFDIRTRYLPSAETEFSKYFNLIDAFQPVNVLKKNNFFPLSDIATFCLNILEKVPSNGICSSLISSESIVLVPTCATSYDWSKLEENAFLIKETAAHLKRSDECLIAKLSEIQTDVKSKNNNNPSGIYLLKPAENVFLACGIVTKEFYLNDTFNQTIFGKRCSETRWSLMKNAISKIPVKSYYNPLDHSSNIFQKIHNVNASTKCGGKIKTKNRQRKAATSFVRASKLVPKVSCAPQVYE
ncbi:DgyrCDS6011 [Dimorphilus gyrociliatus]|uniref:DgyrCDS6011 n=1 Tax=Dimorphilus gyrociliatus TaxID=2664684 RepID=A0A7I8VPJ5_9ANNE|nr:DgyrCDS6011 [Dimorphilus gyrociliatus]